MKVLYILIIVCCCILTGCDEEEKLYMRVEGEPFYHLPQGNHDYDKEIVDWFERCGFYILYDFDEKDLYWDNENWKESGMLDYDLVGYLHGKPADVDFVGQQLDLINQLFFEHYPEIYLTQGMPLKLLLCSVLQEEKKKSSFDPVTGRYETIRYFVDIWGESGFDYIAVNGGNSMITTLSDSLKKELSLSLNTIFLKRLAEKMTVLPPIPNEFFEISNYDGTYYSGVKMFEFGFLNAESNSKNSTLDVRMQNDGIAYMELLGYPLEILEQEPGEPGDDSNHPSLRGVLNPKRDINGLVRRKYEILVAYVKGLGIDLDKIQSPNI